MKNIAIIHHDADHDGNLSNEVCRYHLAHLHPEAMLHSFGWDYGRPLPDEIARTTRITVEGGSANQTLQWEDFDQIYIVDLSVDELMARVALRDKIIWIDHHASAIAKHDHIGDANKLVGYRIDGVAACRLCWQWFAFDRGPHGDPRTHPSDWYLPQKQDFVDRNVLEPRLIRLAGEYDVWDHRDPDAQDLQFGLRSLEKEQWDYLVRQSLDEYGHIPDSTSTNLACCIMEGRSLRRYVERENASIAAQFSQTIKFAGLTMIALNTGRPSNSQMIQSAAKPEHQALLVWRHTGASGGGSPIYISLYHAKGHEDIDLSKIAVKFGGGGHKGACGFRVGLSVLKLILDGAYGDRPGELTDNF